MLSRLSPSEIFTVSLAINMELLLTLLFYFDNLSFNYVSCRSSTTDLSYEVNVIPRFNFPAIFLERIIRSDLPVNLRALAYRFDRNVTGNQKLLQPKKHLHDETSLAIDGLTVKEIDGALCESDKLSSGENKESLASSISGPLTTSSGEVNSNWGVFGKVCRLDRPCVVDEVHLRRFDGLLVTYLRYVVTIWP